MTETQSKAGKTRAEFDKNNEKPCLAVPREARGVTSDRWPPSVPIFQMDADFPEDLSVHWSRRSSPFCCLFVSQVLKRHPPPTQKSPPHKRRWELLDGFKSLFEHSVELSCFSVLVLFEKDGTQMDSD